MLNAVGVILGVLAVLAIFAPTVCGAPQQRFMDLLVIWGCIAPARSVVEERSGERGSFDGAEENAPPHGSDAGCPTLVTRTRILASGTIEVDARIARRGERNDSGRPLADYERRDVKITLIPRREADQTISWKSQYLPEDAGPVGSRR